MPEEEKCPKHGIVYVAINQDTGKYLCNSCIFVSICLPLWMGTLFFSRLTSTFQDEDCSNLVFLAQLAKDLRNQYNAALNSVILKAKKVEELNFDMKEEKLK